MEYHLHNEALASMRYISGTKLDERVIRCDLDPGYQEGRQFGRGKSGGQVRDEYREEYDGGRGGSFAASHHISESADLIFLDQVDGVFKHRSRNDVGEKSRTASEERPYIPPMRPSMETSPEMERMCRRENGRMMVRSSPM